MARRTHQAAAIALPMPGSNSTSRIAGSTNSEARSSRVEYPYWVARTVWKNGTGRRKNG